MKMLLKKSQAEAMKNYKAKKKPEKQVLLQQNDFYPSEIEIDQNDKSDINDTDRFKKDDKINTSIQEDLYLASSSEDVSDNESSIATDESDEFDEFDTY